MATDRDFVDYVSEQAGLGARLSSRRMFGEYAFYLDGKVVAFACDNSLFVKPSAAAGELAPDLPRRPPYPGAKDYPVADELLDDGEAPSIAPAHGRADAGAEAGQAQGQARHHRAQALKEGVSPD
ncbi:TfoX/Sxy family protein [Pseudoxanthomonas sp.]|uniref:TfoX/Sxy family protein n=1 Tax=Pseudoxanthomonas sp. TaxID=1871049 RepID=UPI0025907296|nr:TfoX/Sxy family protein [Pseudoxanthomonas sp.]MCR6687366.1 TfoX/Sxy family protein [Pseudoxanthomonas sp.]